MQIPITANRQLLALGADIYVLLKEFRIKCELPVTSGVFNTIFG